MELFCIAKRCAYTQKEISIDYFSVPPKTLGLRMVKILAEDQLQGNLEVISKEGTTIKMEFDIENSGEG